MELMSKLRYLIINMRGENLALRSGKEQSMLPWRHGSARVQSTFFSRERKKMSSQSWFCILLLSRKKHYYNTDIFSI